MEAAMMLVGALPFKNPATVPDCKRGQKPLRVLLHRFKRISIDNGPPLGWWLLDYSRLSDFWAKL